MIKRLKSVCFILIGFLLGLSDIALASEEEIVSLPSLIEEAKENNPEIEALLFRLEAEKEAILQTQFLEDPELIFTQWGIPENLYIGQSEETWLGIAQAIPIPGKRALKGKIAALDRQAAEQAYRAKVQEITASIKSAYYQLFLLEKNIDIHKEHQTLLKKFIEIARKKYAVGVGSQQDILKAEVELSKLHNGLITLTNSRLPLWAKINSLVNRPIETPIGRAEDLTPRPFPFTYDELTKEALLTQPQIKTASLRVEQQTLAKKLAQKEWYPDFMVELQYWNVHGDENRWMAMGKMNLPWFFKQKVSGKNRKASLEEREAKSLYLARKNETISEILSLYKTIKTTEQLLANYQTDLLPLASRLLEVAQINYQGGKTDFLNLIESERSLLDFQMEYYIKLTEFLEQIAHLEPMIGKEIDL